MKSKTLITLALLLLTTPALATTWGQTDIDDPFAPGFKCEAHEPASYGSYIYHWPSKYDQVFWPFTDSHAIWHCPESGYTSFMTDFDELSESEKNNIKSYLDINHIGNSSQQPTIKLLEDIYAIRNIDDAFANKLLRIFSRWHQEHESYATANEYRLQAFTDIKSQLNTELPEGQKLEYLYLSANYAKFFGNVTESEHYAQQLLFAIDNLENEELDGYAEYLKELLNETEYIQPGGILDPDIPEKDDSKPE